MSREEMNAIISLAQKIIKAKEKQKEKEILRKSEDYHDTTGYMGPEKCENCND